MHRIRNITHSPDVLTASFTPPSLPAPDSAAVPLPGCCWHSHASIDKTSRELQLRVLRNRMDKRDERVRVLESLKLISPISVTLRSLYIVCYPVVSRASVKYPELNDSKPNLMSYIMSALLHSAVFIRKYRITELYCVVLCFCFVFLCGAYFYDTTHHVIPPAAAWQI